MVKKAVAIRDEKTALQKFSEEELALIKATVAKDATDNELALFLYTLMKTF